MFPAYNVFPLTKQSAEGGVGNYSTMNLVACT
ncbi:hypothetical protein T09_15353 [Trichinella sp. T9]|nr:hypothetical protein T09_15353 [Trichinella sp. T9]